MPHASLSLIVILLTCAAGCAPARKAAPVAEPRASRALSAPEAKVLARQQRFLRGEGEAQRGPIFAQLAMELGQAMRASARPWSALELYALLGQPDLIRERGGTTMVLYLYDRYADRDWAMFFEIDVGGAVRWIGVNEATPQLREGFTPFPGFLDFAGTRPHSGQRSGVARRS